MRLRSRWSFYIQYRPFWESSNFILKTTRARAWSLSSVCLILWTQKLFNSELTNGERGGRGEYETFLVVESWDLTLCCRSIMLLLHLIDIFRISIVLFWVLKSEAWNFPFESTQKKCLLWWALFEGKGRRWMKAKAEIQTE